MSRYYNECKVTLIGPEGVGKSCLLERLRNGRYLGAATATIGTAYLCHIIGTGKDKVHLNIWDTSGQGRFNQFLPIYIHGCKVVLICTDKPDPEILRKYTNLCREYSFQGSIFLIITKSDLIYDRDAYYDLEEEAYIQGVQEIWYLSALSGENVSGLFERISRIPLENPDDRDGIINLEVQDEKPRRCLC
jgi:small GTP-binding protein